MDAPQPPHREGPAGPGRAASEQRGRPEEPEPQPGGELTVEKARSVAEQAILQAQREGAFENLPGAGRPLEGLDRPHDPDWWARDKLRRENADLSAALPVVLQLRREKAGLLEAVLALPTEDAARAHLEDFNARVLADRRRPPATEHSPPVVGRVDVEDYLARWRAGRPVVEAEATRLAAEAAEARRAQEEAQRAARPRRWWRRRR